MPGPQGPQIRVYPITQEEAASIKKTERIIRRAGYASIALGTVACAAGGIAHYFGGQDFAKTANEIVECGFYALGAGSIAFLGLLSDRIIDSLPEPSKEGSLDLEKRVFEKRLEETFGFGRFADKGKKS